MAGKMARLLAFDWAKPSHHLIIRTLRACIQPEITYVHRSHLADIRSATPARRRALKTCYFYAGALLRKIAVAERRQVRRGRGVRRGARAMGVIKHDLCDERRGR